MTEKLFLSDPLLRSCTATVTHCQPGEGGWLVETSRTVLFPEGGGQLSDCGSIGTAQVSHVSEKQACILHLCNQPLEVGAQVDIVLDWDIRLNHMQQHTGEHILSHALWHLFDANNIGFHMSASQQVTIDMDTELTPEQLVAAEDYANCQIWRDLPVTAFTAQEGELETLPMRKKTDKVQGELRVVQVEDGDCCTCCGTHLPRTGMVGSIRILRQERYKGGVRIHFLCGRWALEDARRKNSTAYTLAAAFSCKPQELEERVARLREDAVATSARLRVRTQQLWVLRSTALLERGSCVVATERDCTQSDAKALLQCLTAQPQVTAVVVYTDGERLGYLVGKGEKGRGDCGFICQLANGLFNGKGGGRDSFAQGSASFVKDWEARAQQLEDAMCKGMG